MAEIIQLLIAILGTYGLISLISDYDGPFNVFFKLRSSRLGKLFECGVCLSPYFALIPVLGLGMSLYEYLAVIGGSVILSRLV